MERLSLERAAERFADAVSETVTRQVERAWSLERERIDAELAELRDEIASVARPGLEADAIHFELAALSERMATLTGTVAALMGDGPHSVKVPDGE